MSEPNDAWTICEQVTASIETKANKNKRRARRSTLTMTASSALVPVALAALPDGWPQKLIASLLAATVVIVGSWVQIERPHERWVLYRRYHRILEAEQLNFQFSNSPYDKGDKNRTLAKRVAELQLNLHDDWEGIVPSSGEARRIAGQGES